MRRGRKRLLSGLLLAAVPGLLAVSAVPRPAQAAAARDRALPLTFDEAKAQGTQVDWGPTCDTSTGKLAVPSGYAPPCVEPWLGGDNGGATATHALLEGSPAIDAADPDVCPTADQRGVPRPQGPACDVGAVERVP